MNDTRSNQDDLSAGAWRPLAGDDLLPPVEPPSARFIIQLFVVPALIVLMIVLVWLSFNWLVRRTASRPQDVIKGLETGPSVARWQRASELADMLRNARFAEFKRNPDLAAQLAGVLDRQLAGGGMTEDDVQFRKYLARALGEFEVQEGIDVLLKAVETHRDPREQIVRDGALQAIAVRAFNLHALDPPVEITHPDLQPTLFRLAGDEDAKIRFQTAYVLGQIGTPAAIERLEVMVDDPDADTRYNAAVALAHHGNDRAAETLAEMLAIDEPSLTPAGVAQQNSSVNRPLIVDTAINAAKALAQQNPDADLSLVIEALQRIVDADPKALANAHLPGRVVAAAREALQVLRANGVERRAG
jgi:HEAT repeat protein